MPVISEIIRVENDDTLSFGNHDTTQKQKVEDFEFNNDIYRIKTHNEITRIKRNGNMLLETVPGSTIHNFNQYEKTVTFSIEGFDNTSITLGLERDTAYRIIVNGSNLGSMKSNSSGKINFSLDLTSSKQDIEIEKL